MGPAKFKPKIIRGSMFKIMFQKTKNTSLPKSVNERNMKNTKISRNFCKFYSVVSSGLPELGPAAAPPGPALFGPKISSQVKLRVNKAGNRPNPMTKPPFWLPNMPLAPPSPKALPLLKF
jgi:hypothetical protein